MEGALQRWFREMVLVCAAGEKQRWILEHKIFSKTGIISHKTYNKSHKTKQRDRPDQDKEKKNELPRLVLIMECGRERCGQACVF